MHERQRPFERYPICEGRGLIVVGTPLEHFRAERPHPRVLVGVVLPWHAYGDRDSEYRARVREAEAVVAAGRRHDSSSALLV